VETVDSTGIPEPIGGDNRSNRRLNSNETSRRKSPKQKKLLKQNFKGMQGSGSDEHYKLGRCGGAYRGKPTMKSS